MAGTCDPCFELKHFRCRGCDCSVCDRKKKAVVRKAPRKTTAAKEGTKKKAAPRQRPTYAERRNPGNLTLPLDHEKVVGLYRMIRNYQLTGSLD